MVGCGGAFNGVSTLSPGIALLRPCYVRLGSQESLPNPCHILAGVTNALTSTTNCFGFAQPSRSSHVAFYSGQALKYF